MEKSKSPSLSSCLMMDALGMASYLLPGIGETIDVIWAFISAYVFYTWFRTSIGTTFALGEEILPFTDIIPSFTLGYFMCDNKK